MSYAGDITPSDAYEQLANDPKAVLVDCRTQAEWTFVGVPTLDALGKVVHFIEWNTFPDGERNTNFLADLNAVGLELDQPILFLCRSGVRSIGAAKSATAAGYTHAYNVLEGFEGALNDDGQRGEHGWKAAQLPWTQR